MNNKTKTRISSLFCSEYCEHYKNQQKLVAYFIEYELVVPSHGQAIKIRKLSEKKKLTNKKIEEILREKKGN